MRVAVKAVHGNDVRGRPGAGGSGSAVCPRADLADATSHLGCQGILRVQELLEAYQRESNGKITLINVDPQPFSEEEDRAVAYGLRGIPLDDEDATLYFGLVASGSTDQEQAIPFFSSSRERFLEYDLTRLIYGIVHPKLPTVGLISSLPINGPGPMAMSSQSRLMELTRL